MQAQRKIKFWEWTILVIWFACFIASLEFFRFKFGLHRIGIFFLVIGISIMWLFRRLSKPKSS
jgi:hypothetical protein